MQLVRLVDDVDGKTDAAETVTFGLGRTEYEIDLGPDNAEQLKAEIMYWIQFARKRGAVSKPVNRRVAAQQSTEATGPTGEWWRTPEGASDEDKERYHVMRQEIREWGMRNGWPSLGDRGRLPRALYEKWWNVHNRHRAPETEVDDPDDADVVDDDAAQTALDMTTVAPPFTHGGTAKGAQRKRAADKRTTARGVRSAKAGAA